MTLTFGQAKQILAQYQGKGGKLPTAEHLDQFVIKVLQYLLITGSPDAERVFEINAVNGVFTAPYELETPLKAKINGRVGNMLSKWFEFRSVGDFHQGDCYDRNTIIEQANTYYTAYDVPSCGSYVGILGTATESPDAHIIIQGDDCTGRPVFTNHKGAEIAGEYLSIKKGEVHWSNVRFGKITGVVKTKTVGYTPLYWSTDLTSSIRGMLADYSPVEEIPSYRRYRLSTNSCPIHARLHILGRTRIKLHYADNDRIPFDNLYTIEVAGQQVNSQYNKELDAATQQDNFLQSLVSREAAHKRPTNGNPLEVFYPTSAGTIKGIV